MDFSTFTSMEFLTALMSIIVIDLVLAGDNAVVIAMAANRLSKDLRKKAVFIGTAGAVIIRVVMTIFAVYLLTIPCLQAIGGLVLIPIAVNLLKPQNEGENIEAADTLSGAVKTIIVADAAMGIDNVLGVAGAAEGSLLLVVIGLLISIPIVVGCSQIIGKAMEKWPVLIYIGSAILGHTAGNMIVHDSVVGAMLEGALGGMADFISWAIAVIVCIIGYSMRRKVSE